MNRLKLSLPMKPAPQRTAWTIKLCAALALAASAAHAGESANYSITPEAQSSGGRTSSVNYTIDTASTSGGVITSADYTLRPGFAGSLYDPAGISISASPLTLDEGTTRQLTAAALLDDTTTLALSPQAVTWSVQSGPLTGISATGLASAGNVFQNTSATARGDYSGFSGTVTLNILNVGSDDFSLYAGDGLPDDWQVLYFGTGNPAAGPLLDPDNDGWINLFEYRAGINPANSASVFRFRISPVPGQPAQRRIIFSPVLPGRIYTVMSSTTMLPGSWTPLSGATVSDDGDERTVTDPNAGGARKYYRVEVQKP